MSIGNERVKRLCAATTLLEWIELVKELQEASSDEAFRWRVLHACLKHFVELETNNFERQVYEYCLTVFELFDPELSPAREQILRNETDRRACVISAEVAFEFKLLSAPERDLVELVRNGKIKEDELIAQVALIKTSRTWALLNFCLYSGLYAMKYGNFPGLGFSILTGVTVGFLGRLFNR